MYMLFYLLVDLSFRPNGESLPFITLKDPSNTSRGFDDDEPLLTLRKDAVNWIALNFEGRRRTVHVAFASQLLFRPFG